MSQFGGKDSKRHFTVVMGGKEHGLYVSSTPSSAAKKAVTKLCAANKSKKVEFSIREITQGSKKKTYGPYEGHIEKLKEPIELKGRVIRYKPVAKLSGKSGAKKGGMFKNPAAGPANSNTVLAQDSNSYNYSLPPQEQIAFIEFKEPERFENNGELYEKSVELKNLDDDIFNINISDLSRNNSNGKPAKRTVAIYFNDYSEAKKNKKFKENLNKLIELLKFFKEAEKNKLLDTKLSLFTPDDSFSHEHNEFLTYLHKELEKK